MEQDAVLYQFQWQTLASVRMVETCSFDVSSKKIKIKKKGNQVFGAERTAHLNGIINHH